MNFNRGDRVVHQDFGVGTVVSIEWMNFSGNADFRARQKKIDGCLLSGKQQRGKS